MTIETTSGAEVWPSTKRYARFVGWNLGVLLCAFTVVMLMEPVARINGVGEYLEYAFVWGRAIGLPVGILAMFPGIWLFRRLFSTLVRWRLPGRIAAAALSVLIFFLAHLGAWTMLRFLSADLALFALIFGGMLALICAPITATAGWFLLGRTVRAQ